MNWQLKCVISVWPRRDDDDDGPPSTAPAREHVMRSRFPVLCGTAHLASQQCALAARAVQWCGDNGVSLTRDLVVLVFCLEVPDDEQEAGEHPQIPMPDHPPSRIPFPF